MRRPRRLPIADLAPCMFDAGRPRSVNPQFPAVDVLPIEWPAVFGNDRPVEIEVGCGKGSYLVAAAQCHPTVNYLGIEVIKALQYYIASRLAKRGLTNARIACTDARELFRDRIASESVSAVHVYFPDPWWKTRHHKRRVWTPAFASDVARVLTPGGRLHIATDVSAYYEIIRAILDARTDLIRLRTDETTGPPDATENLTNFERKALQRGGSVFRAEYGRGSGE